MEYVQILIRSDRDCNELFQDIMEKNKNYWKKFESPDKILAWLSNFSNEREMYLALILARNMMYYANDEIISLLKLLITNRVKEFIINNEFDEEIGTNIDKWYKRYLRNKCVFVGYGRATKSGQLILPIFQKSHSYDLKYLEFFQLLHSKNALKGIDYVFLIDDFIGTGDQASREWYNEYDDVSLNILSKKHPDIKFVYLVLISCKDGKRNIKNKTPLDIISVQEFDDRFKCFSNISMIYEDPSERIEAKKIMENKGKMLYEHPLGYGEMELALAFNHNTPNNSLPVIWKKMVDESWHPLFERYE